MPLLEALNRRCFQWVHSHNLVYNACWEDPRLDRAALKLGPDDTVLVITSAGCNALDYLLDEPRHLYAVDLNPRQNALLELKRAGIRALDFGTFFAMFGRGRLVDARDVYQDTLRHTLAPEYRAYWDRHIDFFAGRGWRQSFYFRGTSGTFARLINGYIDAVAGVRDHLLAILNAGSIDQQREIYDAHLRPVFWSRLLRWLLGRDSTLSLLGVPRPQRQQVEACFPGGIAHFIEDCVETVFARLPLADNYFWRVYLTGQYTPECCPEYLKPANFARLRAGLVDRLSIHTAPVHRFLCQSPEPISRFVLLDHMDWHCAGDLAALAEEWQAIVDQAAPRARLLWRSGGLRTDFLDAIHVRHGGQRRRVADVLVRHDALAARLHALDRVHTYGSFHIADLAA